MGLGKRLFDIIVQTLHSIKRAWKSVHHIAVFVVLHVWWRTGLQVLVADLLICMVSCSFVPVADFRFTGFFVVPGVLEPLQVDHEMEAHLFVAQINNFHGLFHVFNFMFGRRGYTPLQVHMYKAPQSSL